MEGADILFWLVAAGIAAFAGLTLSRAAGRTQAAAADPSDAALYRAQLAEVERDLERGTVTPEEATRLRTEIGRRILAVAGPAPAEAAAPSAGPAFAYGIIGLGMATAFGLYAWLGAPGYPDLPHSERVASAAALRENRPSQEEATRDIPERPLAQPDEPEMAALVEKLREAVAARPDDLQGHELLARNEAALGNAAAAAAAQARVVDLKGDKATAADLAFLADNLILAAQGYVSPEAEAALLRAIALDPGNGTVRFYLGLLEAQTGRPDRAFAIWRELLEASPPDAPWTAPIRGQIEFLARAAGVDYSLPPEAPGPTDADVAAAGEMTDAERTDMIRGMVDRLAQRIENDGGSAEEWARLVSSLAVLGDTEAARSAWTKAQDVFAADPSGLETVAAAARQAGVLE